MSPYVLLVLAALLGCFALEVVADLLNLRALGLLRSSAAAWPRERQGTDP